MKYKLFVSDIDATLVDNNQRISERTKALINEFQSRGGIFTFATGRIEESVRKYYKDLKVEFPAILYNGAKIVDLSNDKNVYEQTLDMQHAKDALMILRDYNYDILVYHKGKAYVSKINDVIRKYMKKDGIECSEVGDLYDYLDKHLEGEPTKILIIGDREGFGKFKDTFLMKCDTAPSIVNSEPTYLEILPIGISKGHALEKLVETLQIPIGQVVAIGDNLNDVEMVKYAGLGVAVANAHPELIKVADYVTKSNEEEGVAEVLQKVLNDEI